jgi:hypothetical protein
MNNWLVALVYGVIATFIGFIGTFGEPNRIWFSCAFGVIFVAAKELINNQMLGNPFNSKVFNFGLLGVVVTIVALLLV